MSGIFPANGVIPTQAVNSVDFPTENCADNLFYGPGRCRPVLDTAAMNAIMSEILSAVNCAGLTYDCARLDNLCLAIQQIGNDGVVIGGTIIGGSLILNRSNGLPDVIIDMTGLILPLNHVPATAQILNSPALAVVANGVDNQNFDFTLRTDERSIYQTHLDQLSGPIEEYTHAGRRVASLNRSGNGGAPSTRPVDITAFTEANPDTIGETPGDRSFTMSDGNMLATGRAAFAAGVSDSGSQVRAAGRASSFVGSATGGSIVNITGTGTHAHGRLIGASNINWSGVGGSFLGNIQNNFNMQINAGAGIIVSGDFRGAGGGLTVEDAGSPGAHVLGRIAGAGSQVDIGQSLATGSPGSFVMGYTLNGGQVEMRSPGSFSIGFVSGAGSRNEIVDSPGSFIFGYTVAATVNRIDLNSVLGTSVIFAGEAGATLNQSHCIVMGLGCVGNRGRIGINTDAPTRKMHIVGGGRVTGDWEVGTLTVVSDRRTKYDLRNPTEELFQAVLGIPQYRFKKKFDWRKSFGKPPGAPEGYDEWLIEVEAARVKAESLDYYGPMAQDLIEAGLDMFVNGSEDTEYSVDLEGFTRLRLDAVMWQLSGGGPITQPPPVDPEPEPPEYYPYPPRPEPVRILDENLPPQEEPEPVLIQDENLQPQEEPEP